MCSIEHYNVATAVCSSLYCIVVYPALWGRCIKTCIVITQYNLDLLNGCCVPQYNAMQCAVQQRTCVFMKDCTTGKCNLQCCVVCSTLQCNTRFETMQYSRACMTISLSTIYNALQCTMHCNVQYDLMQCSNILHIALLLHCAVQCTVEYNGVCILLCNISWNKILVLCKVQCNAMRGALQ